MDDGRSKIDSMLYAADKHRPGIRLTIRQLTRALDQWRRRRALMPSY
jgi:hypothetical protein